MIADTRTKPKRLCSGHFGFDEYVDCDLQSSLSLCNKCRESVLVGDGDLGKHLSVQIDAGELEAVHELRIVDAVELAACGDTGDPETTEIALSQAAADVGILAGLHDGFLSHLKVIASCTPVALSELYGLISSLARCERTLYTSHLCYLQNTVSFVLLTFSCFYL